MDDHEIYIIEEMNSDGTYDPEFLSTTKISWDDVVSISVSDAILRFEMEEKHEIKIKGNSINVADQYTMENLLQYEDELGN